MDSELNQTRRASHNAQFNQHTVEKVSDSVFTKRMLGAKTYYTALKEAVGMHPKHPVYHKERVSTIHSARTNDKGGSLLSPTITTPKSSHLKNMSTFHNDEPSENKFYYLGRRRQEQQKPDTSTLIKSIFEEAANAPSERSVSHQVKSRSKAP